jgi:putative transposase
LEDTLMNETTTSAAEIEEVTGEDLLEQLTREGARSALQAALEEEVARFLQRFSHLRDARGRRLAIRNGHLPERTILSGIGPLLIHQPRIDDRKLREAEGVERFSSAILPRFMRRMPSVEGLIPVLYLKGISTGDFGEALAAILGEGAKGLSATNITRMKEGWLEEHRRWSARSLEAEEFVYLWVDGIHINVRLDEERVCLLVIIGATREGKKVLVAVSDGYRESKESWRELLLDLQHRGLKMAGKLAIGDGALGFWAAAGEVFPGMKHQRCWVHKTANVLDKLPKGVQSKAKSMIHEMYQAETKEGALKAYRLFIESFQDKYPRAVECLQKDEESLFTFYEFPAAHWIHIRTTNPIESTFATVRLRTAKTKGCGSRAATLSMAFKLCREAEKSWRRLGGTKWIAMVLEGKRFVDGELEDAA